MNIIQDIGSCMEPKNNRNAFNKVLVTGCSRGIGYFTALEFVRAGYSVIASVRSRETADEILKFESEFPNLSVVELDVTDEIAVRSLTKKIKDEGEVIDVLVHSAGRILFGPLETLSLDEIRSQFEVNLMGSILLTQELLPMMRANCRGHIICLGSTSGIHPSAFYPAYSASKFCVEAVYGSLAVNLKRWGIRVSIVVCDATDTDIANSSLTFGSRMRDFENPYIDYSKNACDYLKSVLKKGNDDKATIFL